MRELLPEDARCIPLEPMGDLRRGYIGVRRNKEMEMVRPDGQPQDLQSQFRRFASHQNLQPIRNGANQHRATATRDPNEMVVDEIHTVPYVSIAIPHVYNIADVGGLYPRAKARGFTPVFLYDVAGDSPCRLIG